jgi:hypothetical protein
LPVSFFFSDTCPSFKFLVKCAGIEGLFKKNKVEYVKGWGKFKSPTEVEVTAADGTTSVVKAKNVVIATGSDVAPLPGVPIDEERYGCVFGFRYNSCPLLACLTRIVSDALTGFAFILCSH